MDLTIRSKPFILARINLLSLALYYSTTLVAQRFCYELMHVINLDLFSFQCIYVENDKIQ